MKLFTAGKLQSKHEELRSKSGDGESSILPDPIVEVIDRTSSSSQSSTSATKVTKGEEGEMDSTALSKQNFLRILDPNRHLNYNTVMLFQVNLKNKFKTRFTLLLVSFKGRMRICETWNKLFIWTQFFTIILLCPPHKIFDQVHCPFLVLFVFPRLGNDNSE